MELHELGGTILAVGLCVGIIALGMMVIIDIFFPNDDNDWGL